tara:strand:- start:35 stop:286 length:252 start_codon:yes stop_codon:yes gene_type:complete
MRLESIPVDVGSLQKLIDFLHSDANMYETPTGTRKGGIVFVLEEAKYIKADNGEDTRNYLVTIGATCDNPDAYFRELVEALSP